MEKSEQADHASDKMILRDYLALDRTRLANDRTLLSFLRTGLYLLATGFAFMELESLEDLKFLTWLLISASMASFATGIINYFVMRRKINSYYKDK